MKKNVYTGLSILISLLITPIYAAHTSKEQTLDDIVAVVNDFPIKQTELNEGVATLKNQMMASGTAAPSDEALRKQVLQQMIDRKIQLQLAEQSGIKVDDAQLDKAVTH